MTSVHVSASTGYQTAADTYARGRPDYPTALDAWLRDTLRLGPGRTVLDLGAGTGKFTTRLAETGASVIAVEPVEAMRLRLAADLLDVKALAGSAEAIPVADASVDALVCAQAFHWFATKAALDEMHRVIAPGGRLGLVWNVRDETVPWVARLTELITPYEAGTPRFHTGDWRKPFPHPGFGPLEETRIPHGHTGPAEQVIVDRILSVSFIAALPPDERQRLAGRIRNLIASDPTLAGKAEVTFPYVTLAIAADRL